MRPALALTICLGLSSALGAAGCQSNSYAENDNVRFRVLASNVDIVAGDVVTFSTRSENTLGRDAKVTWTSTGGELDTEDGGRIARATFKKPGTYTVTGRLELDGQPTHSDSIDVRVKPIR
jgi:plastocyanin